MVATGKWAGREDGCRVRARGRTLIPSLVLGLLLGADSYRNTLATLRTEWSLAHLPLITLALAAGLFEAVFFRGWLQLCFEAAFGLLPGLLLGALRYALYHVGYGMGPEEMATLFFLGIVFGAVFRLTRNALVLWPFYTPVGGLFTTMSDGLSMPLEASIGFGLTIGMMAGAMAVAWRWSRRSTARSRTAGRRVGGLARSMTTGEAELRP